MALLLRFAISLYMLDQVDVDLKPQDHDDDSLRELAFKLARDDEGVEMLEDWKTDSDF